MLVSGCRGPVDVHDSDPSVKIPAIKKAVREDDRRVIAQLIEDLDSDDSAIRLYSIQALQRMTGEDLGYRYWEDDRARAPAIERWRQWLEQQNLPATP